MIFTCRDLNCQVGIQLVVILI